MNPETQLAQGRREYGLKTGIKTLYFAFAVLAIAGAGFMLNQPESRKGNAIWPTALFFLLVGLFLAALALRSRLILEPDHLELQSPFRTRTARRIDIEGTRTIQSRNGSWLRICLKNDQGGINISDTLSGRDDLLEWLHGLPNLDQIDANQILEKIRSQGALRTDEEVATALKQAKTWGIGLIVVTVLASLPALFSSDKVLHEIAVVILALLPIAAILSLRRSPLLFTVFKRKLDPRRDLSLVVLWPGIALWLTGADQIHLVDASLLLPWGFLVLLGVTAALFKPAWENPSRAGAVIGLLMIGGFYGFGVASAANTVPDQSSPVPYQTTVTGMRESHGKSTTYYLRLAPWGPIAGSEDVSVSGTIYSQMTVGDPICTELHQGFLHAPWFTLVACH